MHEPNCGIFFDPLEERGHKPTPRQPDDRKNGSASAVSRDSAATSEHAHCTGHANDRHTPFAPDGLMGPIALDHRATQASSAQTDPSPGRTTAWPLHLASSRDLGYWIGVAALCIALGASAWLLL